MDEEKTFAELVIEEIQGKESEQEIILEEYLARELDIDLRTLPEAEKNVLNRNFVHLMCTIISDLRSIDERLRVYKERYAVLENDKTNAAEF